MSFDHRHRELFAVTVLALAELPIRFAGTLENWRERAVLRLAPPDCDINFVARREHNFSVPLFHRMIVIQFTEQSVIQRFLFHCRYRTSWNSGSITTAHSQSARLSVVGLSPSSDFASLSSPAVGLRESARTHTHSASSSGVAFACAFRMFAAPRSSVVVRICPLARSSA